MFEEGVMLLRGDEIISLLQHRELEIIQSVRKAYIAHSLGETDLPQSSFLRIPGESNDRIIALPAYLGSDFSVAGIKWIASFPNNLNSNLERASAVLMLNSLQNGRVKAILESSVISAKRTAASAALAAETLYTDSSCPAVGMIGCGLINFETIRFLKAIWPDLGKLEIFDLSIERAGIFKGKCESSFENLKVIVGKNIESVFDSSTLVALATTAAEPHIFNLSGFPKEGIILHTSLRDLSPAIILEADNVVDDVEHVCRAETSIHVAEQSIGTRTFVRCTLGEILTGSCQTPKTEDAVTIFSPFGLGILDLVVGLLSYELAGEQGAGTAIKSFNPRPWIERA